jgi:hypothetical protein
MAWNTWNCRCGRRNPNNTTECRFCGAKQNRLNGLMLEFVPRNGEVWVHAHPFIERMTDCDVWPELDLRLDDLSDAEREYARLFAPHLGSEYTIG